MPEWNGLKAADEISKVLPGVKMVLHTIYWSAVGPEAKKHGICRVVEKAKTGALVSTIDELIGAKTRRKGTTFSNRRAFVALRQTVLNCQSWRLASLPLPTIPEVVGLLGHPRPAVPCGCASEAA
jgi:hypothetical protein